MTTLSAQDAERGISRALDAEVEEAKATVIAGMTAVLDAAWDPARRARVRHLVQQLTDLPSEAAALEHEAELEALRDGFWQVVKERFRS